MSTSLVFSGNSASYLRIPYGAELARVGDFTIEWFQYQTGSQTSSVIFQFGPNSANTVLMMARGIVLPVENPIGGGGFGQTIYNMGVSIEFDTFYFSIENTKYAIATISNYMNKWVHFAISRTGSTILFFMNGVQIGTLTNVSGIGTYDLILGTDSSLTNDTTSFNGYIYGFHISNGIGRYSGNFAVPTSPTIPDSSSVYYLTGTESLGTAGNKDVKTNISTTTNTPFSRSAVATVGRAFNRILFIEAHPRQVLSNNLVYYKPGTLAGCGVGGNAGNSRVKQRRT